MEDLVSILPAVFVALAALSFIMFLIPGRHARFFAASGWISMLLFLLTNLPYYFSISNFLYPLIFIVSIPFVYITVRGLFRGDDGPLRLSYGAAVAFVIWAPFSYIQPLNQWLISTVASQTYVVLSMLGYPVDLLSWSMIGNSHYIIEIILDCTGIQAISIMLGLVAIGHATVRQRACGVILVIPSIYILNLLRNSFVIMAYTGQWFDFGAELIGNGETGFESFFWSHNVICEGLALIVLIIIAWGVFRIIPGTWDEIEELIGYYTGEVRRIAGKDK